MHRVKKKTHIVVVGGGGIANAPANTIISETKDCIVHQVSRTKHNSLSLLKQSRLKQYFIDIHTAENICACLSSIDNQAVLTA